MKDVMAPKKSQDIQPFETRLRKTGSAAGVTIPAEYLRRLAIEIGDTLQVEIEGDGLRVRKLDRDYDAFMALYTFIEDRFAPALRELEG